MTRCAPRVCGLRVSWAAPAIWLLAFSIVYLGFCSIALAQPKDDAARSDAADADGARAEDKGPEDKAGDEEANEHFQRGLQLFRDQNFAGALAEFEAAYRDRPSINTLQNIALSHKQLFRYAEAAEALELLLRKHGNELSAAKRSAVEQAIRELSAFVGTLVVEPKPADARVTLDGRALTLDEMRTGIRLNVGEHTLVAEAPGFARLARVVRVAGGDEPVKATLALRPTMGFVRIESRDSEAAIAIDQRPLAFGSWSGPVVPGEHTVQIYKDGFQTFEKRIKVVLGQRTILKVPPLKPAGDIQLVPQQKPAPRPSGPQRGWYGVVGASALTLSDSPTRFTHNDERMNGGLGGIRGGYRFTSWFAAEALLEASFHQVLDVCEVGVTCTEQNGLARTFELTAVRFAPGARFYGPGRDIRFSGGFAVGIAQHLLRVLEDEDQSPVREAEQAEGAGAFFTLDAGAQLSIGRGILELVFVAYFHQVRQIKGDDTWTDSGTPYTDVPLLVFPGIALRGGIAQWRP